MGNCLSSTFSPYGFNGVLLDDNSLFCGFQRGSGEGLLYDGLDAFHHQKTVLSVSPNAFIYSVQIQGAKDSLSHGSMTIVDTANNSFTVDCQVKTHPIEDPSTYTAMYCAAEGQMIGSLGIMVTSEGLTVLCDMSSTPIPTLKTMDLNGGAIGYLEDHCGNLVGLITDQGNKWKMFSDVAVIKPKEYIPRYFLPGFLLCGLEWKRSTCVLNHKTGHTPTGKGEIRMISTNGESYSRIYGVCETDVLALNNSFAYNYDVSFMSQLTRLISNENNSKIITSINYWTVNGVTSQRMDFLVQSCTTNDYTPTTGTYGTHATPLENPTIDIVGHSNNKKQRFIMLAVTLLSIGLFVGAGVFIYKKVSTKTGRKETRNSFV